MPRVEVKTLTSGSALNVAMEGRIRLHVIPGAGATVTASKIDSMDASAHDTDSQQTISSETTLDVAWPFYRISTAGGACRISTV